MRKEIYSCSCIFANAKEANSFKLRLIQELLRYGITDEDVKFVANSCGAGFHITYEKDYGKALLLSEQITKDFNGDYKPDNL